MHSDIFYFGRTWQSRRIIWTKDVISLLKVDEEKLIDAIPLAEVKGLKAMNAADPKEGIKNSSGKNIVKGPMLKS